MSERNEDSGAERIEVGQLHRDFQELFRTHEPEVISFKRTVAALSGYVTEAQQSGVVRYSLLIFNHLEQSEHDQPVFLVQIKLGTGEDDPNVEYTVAPDRAWYGDDTDDRLSIHDLQLQRRIIQEAVIDNEEARLLANFVNENRDELGGGDEFN